MTLCSTSDFLPRYMHCSLRLTTSSLRGLDLFERLDTLCCLGPGQLEKAILFFQLWAYHIKLNGSLIGRAGHVTKQWKELEGLLPTPNYSDCRPARILILLP